MMTGSEYKASLRDGRATFFEGKQIDDVTTDPILGVTVDSAAAGYDRFFDPEPWRSRRVHEGAHKRTRAA